MIEFLCNTLFRHDSLVYSQYFCYFQQTISEFKELYYAYELLHTHYCLLKPHNVVSYTFDQHYNKYVE